MLLQSSWEVCFPPGVPGKIWKTMKPPGWFSRMSRWCVCGYLSDLQFADALTISTQFLHIIHCVCTVLSAQWNLCQLYIGSLPSIVYSLANKVYYNFLPEWMNFIRIISLQPLPVTHNFAYLLPLPYIFFSQFELIKWFIWSLLSLPCMCFIHVLSIWRLTLLYNCNSAYACTWQNQDMVEGARLHTGVSVIKCRSKWEYIG